MEIEEINHEARLEVYLEKIGLVKTKEMTAREVYELIVGHVVPNLKTEGYKEAFNRLRRVLSAKGGYEPEEKVREKAPAKTPAKAPEEVQYFGTTKDPQKYGVTSAGYYLPAASHSLPGKSHDPEHLGSVNARKVHVLMTPAGFELAARHLEVIHSGKARFVRHGEAFNNVYVEVEGVQWGLHLTQERGMFPMEGQGRAEYFLS